jgi:hypothetical protein
MVHFDQWQQVDLVPSRLVVCASKTPGDGEDGIVFGTERLVRVVLLLYKHSRGVLTLVPSTLAFLFSPPFTARTKSRNWSRDFPRESKAETSKWYRHQSTRYTLSVSKRARRYSSKCVQSETSVQSAGGGGDGGNGLVMSTATATAACWLVSVFVFESLFLLSLSILHFSTEQCTRQADDDCGNNDCPTACPSRTWTRLFLTLSTCPSVRYILEYHG